jgi:hypothetical protein
VSRRQRERTGNSAPRALAELVREVYPSREPDDVAAIRAFAWWRRAVPERVFLRARPVRMSGNVLYINTATTAWASELDHMKEQLLASVQNQGPGARVKELRFRVGPLPEAPKALRPERPRPQPIALAVLPDKLARALSRIDNDELRDAISGAASVALGRKD